MKVARNSIFLILVVLKTLIADVNSLDDNVINAVLDASDEISIFASTDESLKQQRLDEIKALTAMQYRAGAEREAREKAAKKIRDATDRNTAALAAREARELAYREARELAERESIALAAEKVKESAEQAAIALEVKQAKESAEQALADMVALESAANDAIALAVAEAKEAAAQEAAYRAAKAEEDNIALAVKEAKESAEKDAIALAVKEAKESAQKDAIALAISAAKLSVGQESAVEEEPELAEQVVSEVTSVADPVQELVERNIPEPVELEAVSSYSPGSGDDVVEAEEDSHEDEIMKEILEMQQRELSDQLEEGERIKNDRAEAAEAESTAKIAEAKEAQEAARLEEAASKKKNAADDDWVLRSRPGADAKPGAKLSQTATAGGANREGVDDRSNRSGRDRIPDSARKGQSSGKGNYFGGQSATDKEAEAKKKEAQKKAKETDKMSSGAGDTRRGIEAKLSPEMRNKAAADQKARAEVEEQKAARRSRAAVSRRYARPVERVLSVYNSRSTTLYDVLRVSSGADEGALKKAYRSIALTVHPDKNMHPDSELAFDAIQEAFETLSSPVKRDAYNKEQSKRTSRPSLKKAVGHFKGECSNIKSRLLLFWVRVFIRSEGQLEYQELIGDGLAAMGTALVHAAEHFALLPSAMDRVRLMSEITFDFSRNILAGALLGAILSTL